MLSEINLTNTLYWVFSGFMIIWPSILISFFVKRKNRYWVRLGCFAAVFAAVMTVLTCNGIIFFYVWWGEYFLQIISFLVFIVCNDCSLKETCYMEVWSLAFQNFSAQLPGLINAVFASDAIVNSFFPAKIASLFVFSIPAAFFIRYIVSREIQEITWWEVAEGFIITYAVSRFNRFIFQSQEHNITGINGSMVFILQTFSMLCVILVLFMQLEIHYRKKVQMEHQMRERIWSLEKKQFEERKEQIELINRKCHDLKHQIAALEYISDSEAYKNNIQELKEAVLMYDNDLHTGNMALETILKEKKLQLENEGVVLKCVAEGVPSDFMDVVDLYVLLGNILDNAFESVKLLECKEERMIDVRIFRDKNLVRMIFSNKYSGTLKFSNGLPQSTKGKDGTHGYGLQSVQTIVEKYNGAMTIDTDDGVFLLRILVPITRDCL